MEILTGTGMMIEGRTIERPESAGIARIKKTLIIINSKNICLCTKVYGGGSFVNRSRRQLTKLDSICPPSTYLPLGVVIIMVFISSSSSS